MAGMLQVLTYMFAFYFLIKGIEVLQIGLASPRANRGGLIAIGVLTFIVCGIAAFSFVAMQDSQAQSLQSVAR